MAGQDGRPKCNSFVITATHFGPMLANRLDYYRDRSGGGYRGVGLDLMETNEFSRQGIESGSEILKVRREKFGDGVTAVDVGANIGTHTVSWALLMHGWGRVIAIEAQERIFYALAGNITMNNCFNARAVWAAAGAKSGTMVPQVKRR